MLESSAENPLRRGLTFVEHCTQNDGRREDVMCVRQDIQVTYWQFNFPIFWEGNWVTETVTKWCCTFDWVREDRYFFFARLQGCEDPNLYVWYTWAFGLGSGTYFNMRVCFDDQPSPSGRCTKSQFPTAPPPVSIQPKR